MTRNVLIATAAALALLAGAACAGTTPTPTVVTPTPTATATGVPTPTPTRTPPSGLTPTLTPTTEPTPAPGGALVRLLPATLPLRPGQSVLVEVYLGTNGIGVSGAEIQMSFDPKVLEVSPAGAGDLLGANPLTGLQEVDAQQGRVKVALARVGVTSEASAKGVLVRLSVKAKEGATGATKLELAAVAVSDHRYQLVSQVERQGATLQVGP